jgi:hypothetical protein
MRDADTQTDRPRQRQREREERKRIMIQYLKVLITYMHPFKKSFIHAVLINHTILECNHLNSILYENKNIIILKLLVINKLNSVI